MTGQAAECRSARWVPPDHSFVARQVPPPGSGFRPQDVLRGLDLFGHSTLPVVTGHLHESTSHGGHHDGSDMPLHPHTDPITPGLSTTTLCRRHSSEFRAGSTTRSLLRGLLSTSAGPRWDELTLVLYMDAQKRFVGHAVVASGWGGSRQRARSSQDPKRASHQPASSSATAEVVATRRPMRVT